MIHQLKENEMENIQKDFSNLAEAYNGIQRTIEERFSKLLAKYKVQLHALKDWIHSLSNNLHYYRQKLSEDRTLDHPSMPLEDAIVEVVNWLLASQQKYKLMTDESKGDAVAKVLLDERFVSGIAGG